MFIWKYLFTLKIYLFWVDVCRHSKAWTRAATSSTSSNFPWRTSSNTSMRALLCHKRWVLWDYCWTTFNSMYVFFQIYINIFVFFQIVKCWCELNWEADATCQHGAHSNPRNSPTLMNLKNVIVRFFLCWSRVKKIQICLQVSAELSNASVSSPNYTSLQQPSSLPSGKHQQQHKRAAVTGKLEVRWVVCRKSRASWKCGELCVESLGQAGSAGSCV